MWLTIFSSQLKIFGLVSHHIMNDHQILRELVMHTMHAVTGLPAKYSLRAQDVPPGKWVRPLGSDIEAGATVLAAGERVGAAEIGILATVGAAHVQVSLSTAQGCHVTKPHGSVARNDVRVRVPGRLVAPHRAQLTSKPSTIHTHQAGTATIHRAL